jgi:tetratricopeptide (TPR) repeat protein
VDFPAQNPPSRENPTLGRRLFLILGSLALIYAFLAGLRTVSDFDTFWQMATGRWVVQHHQIPSVDVLSYTANGQHWIYPVGAGVLFYGAFLLGGFHLLSWISAAACAGTVALLLRRNTAAGAAIAILSVPLIADRTPPRADMFSVLLFATFLSILWEYYRTGRALLWLLPPLMVFWVNVHFGFAAGLGLILAYIGAEALELVCGEQRRCTALERLQHAYRWLALTTFATFINPWGWGIYRALLLQQRANAQQQLWIIEWRGVRLNWPAAHAALTAGGPKSATYVLLVVAGFAGIVALLQKRFAAAVLLFGSMYPPVQHTRMGAVFACVLVVVAGPALYQATVGVVSRFRSPRTRTVLAGMAVAAIAMLVWIRASDLVTDRYYFGGTPQISTFGTGLSWWFPERAADFIDRQDLPGEIFNTYDEGGYVTWELGPKRLDYLDGRDTLFGLQRVNRERQLLQSDSDSAAWQQEADQYHINTILLSRGNGIEHGRLKDLCNAHTWRPVYLDNVSAVFVRRTAQTARLIQQFPMNCTTAPFSPAEEGSDRSSQFLAAFNAAAVLNALGRNYEALAASERASALFPGDANAHLERAAALAALDRRSEAEQEFFRAIALSPSEFTWSALADLYVKEERTTDAIAAIKKAAELQASPAETYVALAKYAIQAGHPDDALEAFAEASRTATEDENEEAGGSSMLYKVASGRADAYKQIGDLGRAASYQEEAVQIAPDQYEAWNSLAGIYQSLGRSADAGRARTRAASLTQNQPN